MKIKICGITSLTDARAALDAGADMLGFNFFIGSPRFITPDNCARITAALSGSGAALVGVYVNASVEEVSAIQRGCGLHLAQLSGDETPEAVTMLGMLGVRVVKALRPANPAALEVDLARYMPPSQTPAWLVDAYRPGEYGGTGQTADWSLAAGLAARAPILLAGGLRPENVAAAVRQVRPWGLDVASGVESAPGKKDAQRMADFIQAARSAQSE